MRYRVGIKGVFSSFVIIILSVSYQIHENFFRYRKMIEIYSVNLHWYRITPFGCNWMLKLSTGYKKSDFNN